MTDPQQKKSKQEFSNLEAEIPSEVGTYKVAEQSQELAEYTSTSPALTGGDVDAAWQQADAVGDEAVGGTAATPDQNVTEELEAAVGLEIDDRAFLRTNETLEQRDDSRWELNPTSSEDYQERRD